MAAGGIALLALVSHLFQAFSFGAGTAESTNLAVSAVFLAGLVHATLVATALVRLDIERGTLGLLLSKPVGLPSYLLGRYLGACASAFTICLLVALAIVAVLILPIGPQQNAPAPTDLLAGWGRALFPILVLEAAGLAASSVASRTFAPLLVLILFLAGSLIRQRGLGLLLPDFSLFGLHAGAHPPILLVGAYSLLNVALFCALAFLALSSKNFLRSQD